MPPFADRLGEAPIQKKKRGRSPPPQLAVPKVAPRDIDDAGQQAEASAAADSQCQWVGPARLILSFGELSRYRSVAS